MATTFTREKLYEMVWSEPRKTLAPKLGLSDVGLAKACRRANIPLPERGYWARKQAGKPVSIRVLPPRFPGTKDIVELGGKNRDWHSRSDLLNDPLPPPPEFPEDLETLYKRVVHMVGKVACPKISYKTHPLIEKLLQQDEERRKEYQKYNFSWHKPHYDSTIDKRRLRILNAIFLAVQKAGCKPHISTSKYTENDQNSSIIVGEQFVVLGLEINKPDKSRSVKSTASKAKDKLSLSIDHNKIAPDIQVKWEDTDTARIEDSLTDIVNNIILMGELLHRYHAQRHHDWLVQYKAQLEEEERQKKIEAERRALELKRKREKEQIDYLLAQAIAIQQAETIRNFVTVIRDRADEIQSSPEKIEKWSNWALRQADRIDPVRNPCFLESIDDQGFE